MRNVAPAPAIEKAALVLAEFSFAGPMRSAAQRNVSTMPSVLNIEDSDT
jgi:hypothetical protein